MEILSNSAERTTPASVVSRTSMATGLIVAAMAALMITGLIQSNVRATAQSGDLMPAAPTVATVPLYLPLDSGEVSRFAFGYLEFDWNPADGVPGFGSWPLGTPRQ